MVALKQIISIVIFLYCTQLFGQLPNSELIDQFKEEYNSFKIQASTNRSIDTSSVAKKKQKDKEGIDTSTDTLENIEKSKIQVEKPVNENVVEPKFEFFGGEFFSSNNLIEKNTGFTSAPENYILGIGDEISVNIWGYTEYSNSFKIEADGSIFAQNVGKVFLKGLTYKQARRVIRSHFGKVYNLAQSEIQINLVFSNSIRVTVIGAVAKPKTYYIPAINPVFNIVSLAGLNEYSNIREIEIIRNGKVIRTIDFYDYLIGSRSFESNYLQDNDFIRIPFSTRRVTVKGEVKRPAKFELKEGEGLKELLEFSGGLTNKAFTKVAHLNRYDGVEYVIRDFDLDSLLSGKVVIDFKDKDAIGFSTLRSTLRNYVVAEGMLQINGRYDLKRGMTAKDLIELSGGLVPEAEKSFINVIRQMGNGNQEFFSFSYEELTNGSAQDFELKEYDKLVVYPKDKFSDQFYFKTYGEVRQPGRYDFVGELSLEEAINLSGGVSISALNKIEVTRILNLDKVILDGDKAITETVYVDWNDEEARKSFKVSLLDRIYVRNTYGFGSNGNISIKGEVKYPGEYSIVSVNETLSSIISRAGGLTEDGFIEGGYIIRKTDSIQGRIFLDLDGILKENSVYNYKLRPGDEIYIPLRNSVIQISGAINYRNIYEDEIIMPHHANKRAKHYINRYGGGFSRKAKRKEVYVIQSTGEVNKTKTYLWVFNRYPKVEPGSKIFVGTKPEKVKREKTPIDWTKSIQNFTSSVTGLAMTYILIQNLSR